MQQIFDDLIWNRISISLLRGEEMRFCYLYVWSPILITILSTHNMPIIDDNMVVTKTLNSYDSFSYIYLQQNDKIIVDNIKNDPNLA